MPLDGMTSAQPPPAPIAAQSALPDGRLCSAAAVWFVRFQSVGDADSAVECPWPQINDNLRGVRR
jgi:hypothetical protein